MCIFLFWLADVIFSTLMKNTWNFFFKKLKMKTFLGASVLFLIKKLFIVFFYK